MMMQAALVLNVSLKQCALLIRGIVVRLLRAGISERKVLTLIEVKK